MLPEAVAALTYRALATVVPAWLAPTPMSFMLHVVWCLTGAQVVAAGVIALVLTHCVATAVHVGDRDARAAALTTRWLTPAGVVTATVASALCLTNVRVVSRSFSNPMLRENFALPFLWLEIACVLAVLGRHAVACRTTAPVGGVCSHPPHCDYPLLPGPSLCASSPRTLRRHPSITHPSSTHHPPITHPSPLMLPAACLCCVPRQPTVRRPSPLHLAVTLLAAAFMLTWQFGAFALLLQFAALHVSALVGAISFHSVVVLAACLLAAVLCTAVAMAGNAMLLSSLLCVACVGTLAVHMLSPGGDKPGARDEQVVVVVVVVVVVQLSLPLLIPRAQRHRRSSGVSCEASRVRRLRSRPRSHCPGLLA